VVAKSLQEFETALRIGSEADVAQLVEQPIRNALSLAYVVVEYGGLKVVLGGSRVSQSTVCTAFCTAPSCCTKRCTSVRQERIRKLDSDTRFVI
jgi:hypothetical protein